MIKPTLYMTPHNTLHKLKKKDILKKNKEELLEILSLGDNYYDLDEWSYFLGRNIFGGERYLIIEFTEDTVSRVYKRAIYGFM